MFILYVMWEASILAGHLLALQEGSAVGLMTKESSINFWQGIVVCYLQSIQTTSETSPVHSLGKAAGPGNKPLIFV
jgi:hypothetical protein